MGSGFTVGVSVINHGEPATGVCADAKLAHNVNATHSHEVDRIAQRVGYSSAIEIDAGNGTGCVAVGGTTGGGGGGGDCDFVLGLTAWSP
jgi:hypothetical protein